MNLSPDSSQAQNFIREMYEQFCYDCLYVAMKYLGNQTLAEDAVHDAFLSVLENIEKYQNLSCTDFRRLIVVIVKNKCIDTLRKRKKISATPFETFGAVLESNDIPVEEHVVRTDEINRVCEYVNAIDDTSRRSLQLKYVDGKSYKEIAEEMGANPQTVEVRIARAKQKVRKLMRKDGYDDFQTKG